MPDPLEYIVTGALTQCDKGGGFMTFTSTNNTTVHIQKQLVAIETDTFPLVNIPSYGMCAVTGAPCSPRPTMWQGAYEHVKVHHVKPLIFSSCHLCAQGGTIKFVTSGQVPVDQALEPASLAQINEVNAQQNELVKEYDDEKDSVGESGLVEGFIPVWGSGRDAIHSFQTGHWGMGLLHTGFVVLDVFTLGSDEVVLGFVKGGVKGGAKMIAKSLTQKALAVMALKKAAAELLEKGVGHIAEVSIKYLGVCIAKACFLPGTPVATKDGLKNIEDLKSGDEVWAFNEETGETALKPVLNVFEREADVIIELTIDGEVIATTPEHPFHANGKWKEAGSLAVGDTIQLFNGKAALVQDIVYKFDKELHTPFATAGLEDDDYELTKVFNVEVEGWHTYFVGTQYFLVHNAVCLAKVLEEIAEGRKKLRLIMLGKTPGKASKTGLAVIERMEKEGKILRDSKTGKVTHFLSEKDGKWYKLEQADMAHKEDAVTWWNKNSDKYQARSAEVRDFMKDPDNYYLELDKYNRSDGSILGKTNTYNLPSK